MRTLTKLDNDSRRARHELDQRIHGAAPLARHTVDSRGQRQAGSSSVHESAEKHVTGKALYIDDLKTPADALHVAMGLSPVAHGTLTHLDLEAVRTAPGVVDVITFHDVPGHTDIGPVFPGDPIFVEREISYSGQCLFAVAATSLSAARHAILLANVQIDKLPAQLDAVQAAAQQEFVRPSHTQQRGDWQATLEQAEHVLEGALFIGGQEHFYLEGQACVVIPSEDEGVMVHTSNQHPSETQKLVSEVLDIPFHAVTVEVRRMGGGLEARKPRHPPGPALLPSLHDAQARPRVFACPDMTTCAPLASATPFTTAIGWPSIHRE